MPSVKLSKEKKDITKITKSKSKHEEIPLVKTVLVKKKQINKHSLLSKTYYKNDSCLICGKGHAELTCKNKKCPRVFHLSCMNKSRIVKCKSIILIINVNFFIMVLNFSWIYLSFSLLFHL